MSKPDQTYIDVRSSKANEPGLPFVVVSYLEGAPVDSRTCIGRDIAACVNELAFGRMWDRIEVESLG